MTYRLVISEKAFRQLDEIAEWWAEHRSPAQADRWYSAGWRAIESLRQSPLRFPRSLEDGKLPFSMQDCYFGVGRSRTHRIVFTVRPECVVFVLGIYHLSRNELSSDDIF